MASAAELLTAAIAATDPEARSILLGHARRQDLAERLTACTACDLRRTCRAPVPGELTSSSVAIIGEAPGADEDAAGRPFVGRAGKLLDDCLRLANLDRSKVAIINTVACRPPGNNFDEAVKADAPARCRPWLEEQIKLSGAWLLVPVGAVATRALLPEARQGITELCGSLNWTDTHLVMPTFHPAYALRNPRAKSQIISDLQAVRRVVLGVQSAPLPKNYNPTALITSFAPIRYSESERKWFKSHWNKKGWVAAYSEWLEDSVILVKDEWVDVPAGVRGVKYTVAELMQMRGWANRTWEAARRIHLAKKELGASVI